MGRAGGVDAVGKDFERESGGCLEVEWEEFVSLFIDMEFMMTSGGASKSLTAFSTVRREDKVKREFKGYKRWI